MTLKIAHHGFILIAIPLAFQLVVSGGMLVLLFELRKTTGQWMHSNQQLKLSAELMQDYNQLASGVRITANGLVRGDAAAFNVDLDRLFQKVAHARSLVDMMTKEAATPQEVQRAETMKSDFHNLDQVESRFIEICRSRNLMDVVNYVQQHHAEIWKARRGVIEGLKYPSAALGSAEESESGHQQELNRHAEWLLLIALLFAAVLSFFLAMVFANRITKRVAVLIDNNIRLARDLPLNDLVGGGDELAELDASFHSMAQELTKARERDIAIGRLRDEILGMVGHDIRTPIQTLSTFLELIAEEDLKPQEQQALKIAEEALGTMGKLVNDMLDLEKIQAGAMNLEMTAFPLLPAVREAIEQLSLTNNEKRVKVVSQTDVFVWADRYRIIQVMSNLLAYTMQSDPGGGTIAIAIRQDRDQSEVLISDETAIQAQQEISQGSDFCASSEQTAASSTEAVGPGSQGFGLAVSRALVELHGGKILPKSAGGKTTKFAFTIPCKRR